MALAVERMSNQPTHVLLIEAFPERGKGHMSEGDAMTLRSPNQRALHVIPHILHHIATTNRNSARCWNDLLGICSSGYTKEGKTAFRQPNGWFV
jgi:hypothetical protein